MTAPRDPIAEPSPSAGESASLAPTEAIGSPDRRDEERLISELAVALHESGAPSYDLEDFVLAYSKQLGHNIEVFCSPTSIFLSFDDGEHSKTTMSRMRPGDIDLGKLAEVYQLIGGLSESTVPRSEVRNRLRAIRQRHGAGRFASVVSYSLVCGTATSFFGGGWREAVVATGIGLLLGLIGMWFAAHPRLRRLAQPLGAALAAGLAAAGGLLLTPVSIEIVTLSSLMVLLPGLSITTAISELAQEHLAAGTSRLMGAMVQLLSIGFGVALGRAIASQFIPLEIVAPEAMPQAVFWACLLIAPLSFAVLFRAPWRDFAWIMVACLIAYGAARWGRESFGAELGAAFGAFALGVTSNGLSRLTGCPPQVTLVPALLILVPGSVGFRAVQAFLDHETVQAVQSAFGALFVAAALVSGLLVANVMTQPKPSRG